MEGTETTRVSSLLGWLEEEHHQTKAALGRLQYQLEQLVNLAREQAGQIRTLQEEVAAARNQLGRVSAVEELARQLREAVARLQSSFSQHAQETDKDDKARQGDIERNKQAINEIWLRLDSTFKEFEPLLGKAQTTSDSIRRHDEALGGLAKTVDGLKQQTETLAARTQIAVDQSRRNEGEIESIYRQLDALRGQDDVVVARFQILADKVKQIDEQVVAVLAEEQMRVDLGERLQVVKLEHQRLEKQFVDIAPLVDVHSVRLDEQARETRQVEDRRQLLADDLREVKQLLLDHIARLDNSLIGIEELAERHKRRQVAELEIQASDLKERIARLRGQVQ
ncbi:MAG: hypothetical protein HYX94_11180 [Chloroflexi bacterium]|nr:hypothetical protein [Chloroflexota bacterium]